VRLIGNTDNSNILLRRC